ncbi:MAG: hypothetical protein PHH14_07165, partial [Candidatus Margulisbacteria bacterium]|nr:hypothetical protein [Candidatus Margulisiibacteriota bacterium]
MLYNTTAIKETNRLDLDDLNEVYQGELQSNYLNTQEEFKTEEVASADSTAVSGNSTAGQRAPISLTKSAAPQDSNYIENNAQNNLEEEQQAGAARLVDSELDEFYNGEFATALANGEYIETDENGYQAFTEG